MTINNKYNISDIVFLKTDDDYLARMVTGIIVRDNNSISYELSCAENVSEHYEIEITDDEIDTINFNLN